MKVGDKVQVIDNGGLDVIQREYLDKIGVVVYVGGNILEVEFEDKISLLFHPSKLIPAPKPLEERVKQLEEEVELLKAGQSRERVYTEKDLRQGDLFRWVTEDLPVLVIGVDMGYIRYVRSGKILVIEHHPDTKVFIESRDNDVVEYLMGVEL